MNTYAPSLLASLALGFSVCALACAATAQDAQPDPITIVDATASPGPRRLALVVGVNKYRNLKHLRVAVKDAQDIATALRQADFEVTELSGDAAHEARNPDQILGALTAITNQARPEDLVLFSFSGHGFSLLADGRPQDYLCPQDADPDDVATALSLDRLREVLQGCRARNKVALIDACRSTFAMVRSRGGHQTQQDWQRFGISVLYSTTPGMVSRELHGHRDHNQLMVQNGVFTHFVLQGLTGRADLDMDGSLTYRELGGFVAQQMLELSRHDPQLYQMAYWGTDLRNEFVLANFNSSGPNTIAAWRTILQEAQALPPSQLASSLVPRITAGNRYHTDENVRRAVDQAFGEALLLQFQAAGADPAVFAALVQASLTIDQMGAGILTRLALGTESRDVRRHVGERVARLAGLARAAASEGWHDNELASVIDLLLQPYIEAAVDSQNIVPLDQIFATSTFSERTRSLATLQQGVERMERTGRPDWAGQLALRYQGIGIEPPTRVLVAELLDSAQRGDWNSLQSRVRELTSQREAATARKLLDGTLNTECAAGIAARLGSLVLAVAALGDELPFAQELLTERFGTFLKSQLSAADNVAAAHAALEWGGIATTAGLDRLFQEGLRQAAPNWLELAGRELPAPGIAPQTRRRCVSLITTAVATVPSLRTKATQLFVARGRALLTERTEEPSAADAVAGEYRTAMLFGMPFAEVVHDIFSPERLREPPPSQASAMLHCDLMRVLLTTDATRDGLEQAVAWCAAAAAQHGLLDGLDELLHDARLGESARNAFHRSLEDRLAKPAHAEAKCGDLHFALAVHARLEDIATPSPKTLGVACRGAMPVTAKDAESFAPLLVEVQKHFAVDRQDALACWSAVVALTAKPHDIDRLLAVHEGEYPPLAAANVFNGLVAQERLDEAAPWIAAAGKRVSTELVGQVQRTLELRDQVRTWIERRLIVIQHDGASVNTGGLARRAEPRTHQQQLRIDAVDGCRFHGTLLRGSKVEGQIVGKVGDRRLYLAGKNKAFDLGSGTALTEEQPLPGFRRFAATVQSADGSQGRLLLLAPNSNSHPLQSFDVVAPTAVYLRDGEPWPTHSGGQQLLAPIFVGQNTSLTFPLGDCCATTGGNLRGRICFVDIPAKKRDRWRKDQEKALGKEPAKAPGKRKRPRSKPAGKPQRVAKLTVRFIGSGEEVIVLNAAALEQQIDLHVPTGTRSIELQPEGNWPPGGVALECWHITR